MDFFLVGLQVEWIALIRNFSDLNDFFLNEPHKIVRFSIHIAEKKYKTTVLENHSQEKEKKKKKTHPVGLGR